MGTSEGLSNNSSVSSSWMPRASGFVDFFFPVIMVSILILLRSALDEVIPLLARHASRAILVVLGITIRVSLLALLFLLHNLHLLQALLPLVLALAVVLAISVVFFFKLRWCVADKAM
ncbi:hypothetical protein GmHk_01G000539 [Glycine max]|nr:hypothetical protein GmHk_01G000539 [Glycine max]